MRYPRDERRILSLFSLLILLFVCCAGESYTIGKQHALIKQPEQIKKPRRSPRGLKYDPHIFWAMTIIRMTPFCTW